MKHSKKTPKTSSGNKNKGNEIAGIYNKVLAEYKKGEIGYATIGILAQSCISSIAVLLVLMNDMPTYTKMVLLFIVTIFAMAFNGAVLAQQKSKITLNLLIISVVFSCGVILANLI